jgi:hypothetical protein
MGSLYQKLNKKLDGLTNPNPKHSNTQKASRFQSRLINLTGIKLTKEQIQTLSPGPNGAIEKEPKQHINNLIVDAENATRHLDPKNTEQL